MSATLTKPLRRGIADSMTDAASQPAAPPEQDRRLLRGATWLIIGLHLIPLLLALPNYRASVDSAFHTALGRQYGDQGFFYWDSVHFAPAHRPNLQGPAVHYGIALIGRICGGTGDAYVFANAVMGVLCWLAAVATVIHFARRLSGDLAALLAVAVMTGGVNTGSSLSMNLPVFWMMIVTAWAIHFLIERKLMLAMLVASLACYCHLGGFATVPVGLAAAVLCHSGDASFKQRLRDFVLVAAGLAVLTAPYWMHVLRSLDWYVGVKSDTAWWIDPLVDAFWVLGLVVALRAPQRHALLIAWAAAPLVWIFQDASRFILVSALPGAVLGSVAIAAWLNQWKSDRWRQIAIGAFAYVGTVFPLGIPSLAGEILWLIKPFPILLDWDEMRADAEVIREHSLNDKIVQGYTSYVVSSISVFADIHGEKGHWIEVQPPVDPSDDLGVADKTYVVALPPDDELLAAWQKHGWLKSFGGGKWSSVLHFQQRPSLEDALRARNEVFAREAAWVAEHGEHNTMGNFFAIVLDPQELPRRRSARGESRARAARMQVAALVYAFALEPIDGDRAQRARDDSRALGWIAALQGDEMAMDYRSAADHERLREDLAALAVAAGEGERVEQAVDQLLERYLSAVRGGLFKSKSQP